MQPTRTARPGGRPAPCGARRPYSVLLRVGLAWTRDRCRCGGALLPHLFTLTPHAGRFFSVALSLSSRWPGVTRHPAAMEPGLSSERLRPAVAWPPDSEDVIPGAAPVKPRDVMTIARSHRRRTTGVAGWDAPPVAAVLPQTLERSLTEDSGREKRAVQWTGARPGRIRPISAVIEIISLTFAAAQHFLMAPEIPRPRRSSCTDHRWRSALRAS